MNKMLLTPVDERHLKALRALDGSRGLQNTRIYYYFRGFDLSPDDCRQLADAAFSDNRRYTELKSRHGFA